MWMAGAQLHLFSIMTTASGVYQPISAILKSGEGRGTVLHLGPMLDFGSLEGRWAPGTEQCTLSF